MVVRRGRPMCLPYICGIHVGRTHRFAPTLLLDNIRFSATHAAPLRGASRDQSLCALPKGVLLFLIPFWLHLPVATQAVWLNSHTTLDLLLQVSSKGVLLFLRWSFWQSALFSDPRGTTNAVLRVTNRCALYLKGHFFFLQKKKYPFSQRDTSNIY